MPRTFAASLRLRDPHGFDRGQRDARVTGLRGVAALIIILVVATIIVAAPRKTVAATGRHSSLPRQSGRTGHRFANLKLLWSAYPLRPRRGPSHRRAISRARAQSSQASKGTAGGQRRRKHGSSLAWMAAAGAATTVLLVLVAWQRRRGFPLRKAHHQPSSRLAADDLREDPFTPVVDRSAYSSDRRAPSALADSRRIGVDRPHHDHLLFVPMSTGYTLVARSGDVPPVLFEFDGKDFGLDGRFRVSKIGPSPLPSDERDCAYLERT